MASLWGGKRYSLNAKSTKSGQHEGLYTTLLITLVSITAFAALNWNVFITPTTLSLGVTAVQAPLGLVMLGSLALLTALFLAFVLYPQTSALFEARRHARELQAKPRVRVLPSCAYFWKKD